jgi:hypothetical protein
MSSSQPESIDAELIFESLASTSNSSSSGENSSHRQPQLPSSVGDGAAAAARPDRVNRVSPPPQSPPLTGSRAAGGHERGRDEVAS